MPRFAFTEALDENRASFAENEFQHQIKVLRKQSGDLLQFLDGRGIQYKGRIITIDNRKKWFQVEIIETRRYQPHLPLHLAVALPKGGKLDTIIQKAVELGVTKITPLITERTEVRLNTVKKISARAAHWQKSAIASIKQSGNPYLPEIVEPQMVTQLQLEPATKDSKRVVFHPSAENISFLRELDLNKSNTVTLALGPEGGFSKAEIRHLKTLSFLPVGLGKRILRLETAVVSALTLTQYFRNSF
jgi:16S rRNA (uracil1498-N3)-methyltransferase